ncbi:hypothetical protein A6V39_05080 [Candidatus Mycoplasma haematobovis]|uniref:Uncharacterized protein n=1 Tax=Candidatus Mycoplasma haematobovis TaxID=432608 RepID=A0A1A9QCQ9_9MOLU|nr:hypothetical protein [Candidatus Mycoplasma haematobovis]OAL09801.1 hypothetical protein A6V39_05080 [Candidatus Mycoplasma haematobovis]
MSTLPLKIVGGTVALGSLGTGVYFGGKELLRAPTIKEKLSSENFKFIPSVANSNSQWEAEFKSDEVAIKEKLGSNADATALRQWCESKYGSPSTSVKDLENVKKWCGIRDISSQLVRKNRKLLIGQTGSDVDSKWTKTIEKRKTSNSVRSKLGLEGEWSAAKNDDKDNIKRWCSDKSKEDFLVGEETYKLVEAWCTEQGATIESIQ